MNFDPASVGTADEQQELLNQQLARAQAMRQLAMQRPAYGAAAGIGAGLSGLLGGIHQAQLESQQKDLLQKQQGAMTDAQNAAMDPANQTPEAQRALAMRMMMSGNKQLTGMGKEAMEGIGTGQEQALKGQEVQKGQIALDATKSPQTGEALLLALKRYGFKDLPAGTPTPTLQALMGTAEKGYAAEQGRLSREDVARITQGYGVPGGSGGAGGGPGALGGKRLDKALKELGADFDPNGGRAGEFGKNQARINAANRVIALGADEQGNPRNLTPNQMPEMAQSVASLISAGGQGAQAQIEHLLPKSYSRDAAGILQYFTNEPQGAGQQAFVQQMLDTAKREQAQAQMAIDQTRKQRGAKHQQVILGNPTESARVLAPFGFVLGPDGMPVMKQQTPPPNPATDDLRKKYGL